MNIKSRILQGFISLSLLGLTVMNAQAIPLTMSFSINGFSAGDVNAVIKYDADSSTHAIDSLTFVDLSIGSNQYNAGDVNVDSSGLGLSSSDFSLSFDPTDQTGTFYSGQEQSAFQYSQSIPEPATLALLGIGLTLLGSASRRKR